MPRLASARGWAEAIFRKVAYVQQLRRVIAGVEVDVQLRAGRAATGAPREC